MRLSKSAIIAINHLRRRRCRWTPSERKKRHWMDLPPVTVWPHFANTLFSRRSPLLFSRNSSSVNSAVDGILEIYRNYFSFRLLQKMMGKVAVTVALIVLVAMVFEIGTANPVIGKTKIAHLLDCRNHAHFFASQIQSADWTISASAFGIALSARKCTELTSKARCALSPALSSRGKSFQVSVGDLTFDR